MQVGVGGSTGDELVKSTIDGGGFDTLAEGRCVCAEGGRLEGVGGDRGFMTEAANGGKNFPGGPIGTTFVLIVGFTKGMFMECLDIGCWGSLVVTPSATGTEVGVFIGDGVAL